MYLCGQMNADVSVAQETNEMAFPSTKLASRGIYLPVYYYINLEAMMTARNTTINTAATASARSKRISFMRVLPLPP